MKVSEFIKRTQRRVKDGSLGPVMLDLGKLGRWKISADKIERLDAEIGDAWESEMVKYRVVLDERCSSDPES